MTETPSTPPGTDDMPAPLPHAEVQDSGVAGRLNALRAGVLGANDGIVSTAGIVVGVAGATAAHSAILVAGVAGLVAGALSMAAGEYVSVSTQRDTERALVTKETRELAEMPEQELDELTALYEAKGLEPALARTVAEQLTAKDPLAAHLDAELGIDQEDLANPWSAALASAAAFTLGALLPLLSIVLLPTSVRTPITFVVVLVALGLTGLVSSRLGGSPAGRAVVRNVVGGALAMAVTYLVGRLVGGGIG